MNLRPFWRGARPQLASDWDPEPGWLNVLLHDYVLTVVLWAIWPRYRRMHCDISAQGHPGRHWTTYRRHMRGVAVQTRRLYPDGRVAGPRKSR